MPTIWNMTASLTLSLGRITYSVSLKPSTFHTFLIAFLKNFWNCNIQVFTETLKQQLPHVDSQYRMMIKCEYWISKIFCTICFNSQNLIFILMIYLWFHLTSKWLFLDNFKNFLFSPLLNFSNEILKDKSFSAFFKLSKNLSI